MRPDYWFPAKRRGWGWGPPSAWQGWAVLAAFLALLVLGAVLFPPGRRPARYIVFAAALALILVGICWVKGEPPRWRRGGGEPT